jgi:hypothetical protein
MLSIVRSNVAVTAEMMVTVNRTRENIASSIPVRKRRASG